MSIPNNGGIYTRKILYDGYIRNQKRGGCDGSVQDIKILKMITGLNAAVIETQNILKDRKTGELKEEEKHMTLFEFKDNKIQRIFEYW